MRRQASITKWGQGPEDGETTGGPPLISVMARTQNHTTVDSGVNNVLRTMYYYSIESVQGPRSTRRLR